jgi:glycosyltransferase involved in cell wall biosynthesis
VKTSRPIKVLQVIDGLGMGGAETWLMEVLRLWSKSGVGKIDFLATSGNPGIFDEEARQLGARVAYARYGRAHLRQFAQEFRQVLREGEYDAVHDHQDYTSGWHFLMGAGALPAVRVTHVHNPWLHFEANYATGPLRRLTSIAGKHLVQHLATHVCGTSEEILRRYGFEPMRATHPRVSALHCGFDIGRFNKGRELDRASVLREFCWPEESQVALFVGRLDRSLEFDHRQNHKNSWFALNVVRAAVEMQPSVRFLMAGAGDRPRRELESRVERWGLKDKLRLIGVRMDVARLMRAADVLFFPSSQEGLGMVAVEAQAACLPVLASTAVPRECVVIPELYDALPLSEPIEIWADALLRVLAKPRLPVDFCRRAIGSSPFSIANSARQLEEVYSTTRAVKL